MEPGSVRATEHWEVTGATDVGRKREHNEDVFLIREDLGLFVVCDGMGGHSAGEVAAGMAAQTMAEFFERCEGDPECTWPFKPERGQDEREARLGVAMKLANRRIREAGEQDALRRNMGTTAVAAWLSPRDAFVGWAGDSRAYLFRAGKLAQLTDDHSLVMDMVRAGRLSAAEAETFQYKNVITRAIEPSPTLEPEVKGVDVQPGDVLLLCCDGLHGMVSDAGMEKILGADLALDRCARALVDAANEGGGVDNITCVLVRRKP